MKFNATIFVEGEADIRFIECFVKQRFDYELKRGIELQNSKGKDALKLLQKNFQENTKLEIANLLIFDANGSYDVRKKELIQIREQLSIEFNNFLFPSDKDPGDLETILENIINPAYKNVLNCFDQFQNCLNKIGSQQIRLPDRKDKIYMYASLLSTNELAKERKRDYLNKSLWDLESFHLDPLYNFLKPHFTEE